MQAFLNGQPSKQPVGRNLSAFLHYRTPRSARLRGTVQRTTASDKEACADAIAHRPVLVQAVQDAGDAAGATREADEAAATAVEEGAAELRMAVTAGKRVFVNYADGAQEMGVVAVKGPYVAVLFLDFAGLDDDGKRTSGHQVRQPSSWPASRLTRAPDPARPARGQPRPAGRKTWCSVEPLLPPRAVPPPAR